LVLRLILERRWGGKTNTNTNTNFNIHTNTNTNFNTNFGGQECPPHIISSFHF